MKLMNVNDKLHGFSNRRQKRLLMEKQNGIYHVVTRTSCRRFLLNGAREKAMFVALMRKQAAFCGVEVLAHCVMSNHVHLLVRVPYQEEVPDAVLIKRYRAMYEGSGLPAFALRLSEVETILKRGGSDAKALRKRLMARMGKLSVFVGELKQRFSIWYNQVHKNKGTLWAERFRSQLIQDDVDALASVAAYIELNPIRAQMVKEPERYAYSSYGEAMGGGRIARRGIKYIFRQNSWKGAVERYRIWIYGKGYFAKGTVDKDQGRLDADCVDAVLAREGKVELQEAIKCRVRYFIDGLAMGSREFVEGIFESNRSLFPETRTSGARKLKHIHGQQFVLRDLQKNIIY